MTDIEFSWLVVIVGIFGGVWYTATSTLIVAGSCYCWLKRKIDLNLADIRTMIVSKQDVEDIFNNDQRVWSKIYTKFAYRYNLNGRYVLKTNTNRKLRLVKIWIKK